MTELWSILHPLDASSHVHFVGFQPWWMPHGLPDLRDSQSCTALRVDGGDQSALALHGRATGHHGLRQGSGMLPCTCSRTALGPCAQLLARRVILAALCSLATHDDPVRWAVGRGAASRCSTRTRRMAPRASATAGPLCPQHPKHRCSSTPTLKLCIFAGGCSRGWCFGDERGSPAHTLLIWRGAALSLAAEAGATRPLAPGPRHQRVAVHADARA